MHIATCYKQQDIRIIHECIIINEQYKKYNLLFIVWLEQNIQIKDPLPSKNAGKYQCPSTVFIITKR